MTIQTPRLSFTAALNCQAEPGFQARPVEQVVDGLSMARALREARPETDRVVLSDRINPASDALLLNLVDKLPRSLASMTWGAIQRWVVRGDGTPQPLSERQGEKFRIGTQAPLDVSSLSSSLQASMAEFPQFTPHIGAEHVWSKDAQGFQGLGFWKRVASAVRGERPFPFPTFGRSKLICALGLGATSLVMPTGKESELRGWVLEQKPASIQVHQLFREAYRLHEGDLYGTLLCAENVLSEGLYDPNRQEREVTSRLSYLRSDSAPQGDNFGGWYHMFGAALYSLMRPEWKSDMSLKIEDIGSLILEGKDPQEDHINQIGNQLGRSLKEVARTGLQAGASFQDYVNRAEFDWKRQA